MSNEKALWVPGRKLTDREMEMAFRLFLEAFKLLLTKSPAAVAEISDESLYRGCLETALVISRVESEELPK